ncbi:hypothetical protein DFH27DRAFT_33993 [Peziza echinospora]|nr:hypothetical protein DFH27DRAFT_33993 [Peziza echinospora]
MLQELMICLSTVLHTTRTAVKASTHNIDDDNFKKDLEEVRSERQRTEDISEWGISAHAHTRTQCNATHGLSIIFTIISTITASAAA